VPTHTPATKNIPLLREVMKTVTAYPERTDLDVWGEQTPCGTKYCIAGWAAVLSGALLGWDRENHPWALLTRVYVGVGGSTDPENAGAQLLGLTLLEANELFYAEDLDDAWGIVEDITDGEIKRVDVEAEIALERGTLGT
jgi:hypothetical protein